MTDDVLQAAERKIARLRKKLSENSDFVEYERLRDFISTYHKLVDEPSHSQSQSARSIYPKIIEYIKEIIIETGRPVHVSELLARLQERGLEIAGKNPSRNLSAKLSYSKQFKATSNGWELVENEEGDLPDWLE